MPKSDMPRHPDKPVNTINSGKVYVRKTRRTEAPLLGEGQGDSGKVPVLNHSNNLPMTDNKRAGFKSRVIFDN